MKIGRGKKSVGNISMEELITVLTQYERLVNAMVIIFCDASLRRYRGIIENAMAHGHNYEACFYPETDITFSLRDYISPREVYVSSRELTRFLSTDVATERYFKYYQRLNEIFLKLSFIYENKPLRIKQAFKRKWPFEAGHLRKFDSILGDIYLPCLQMDNIKVMRDDPIFPDKYVEVRNYDLFQELCNIMLKCLEKPLDIFDEDGNLLFLYKHHTLEDIDLSEINFNRKNISGINISKNIGNVEINFDKIQKDLSNCNLEGYDFKGYILRGFDLHDTNLTNISAGIDLLSCKVSRESKMFSGTLFDSSNKFYLGDEEIPLEKAKEFKIKIKE